MTNCMFRHGQEPGLKSVAIATGTPALTMSRAGANTAPRLKLVAGSRHAMTPPLAMEASPPAADDQVLSRDRADLTGELAAADGLDLVGVDLGTQAILETRFEHLTGLFDGEGVGLAEDVAELGDALLLDLGHHLLAHKADVLFAVGLIFRRDKVRAHEGRDEVHAGGDR